jgi:hypothetical protein
MFWLQSLKPKVKMGRFRVQMRNIRGIDRRGKKGRRWYKRVCGDKGLRESTTIREGLKERNLFLVQVPDQAKKS